MSGSRSRGSRATPSVPGPTGTGRFPGPFVVLLVGIILAACQSSVSPSPSTNASAGSLPPAILSPQPSAGASPRTLRLIGRADVPETGTVGGTITIGDWREAYQYNPYRLSGANEANVASAAWSSLATLTDQGTYVPDLAADLPTTANGGVAVPGQNGDAMTVTWTLRPGLKWSDGAPLTCDDFKYAWEWVMNPENIGVLTAGFEDIGNFDCPSATSMIWHFRRVYEGYLWMIPAPLPRHYLESKFSIKDMVNGAGFGPADVAGLPVSGPFKFSSVTLGSEVRLARNPDYTSLATGKPAYLDGLTWRWYGDVASLIAGFRGGAVDIATGLDETNLAAVKGLGGRVSSIPSLSVDVVMPNWSKDHGLEPNAGGCSRNPLVADRGTGCPMADRAVRSAVAMAIDKHGIAVRLLGGVVDVADSSVDPRSWFYTAQTARDDQPAAARQALEQAGWIAGPDGIRVKAGLRAKVELCTTSDDLHQAIAVTIVTNLRAVGIEVVPNFVTADSLNVDAATALDTTPCALSRGNFDLAEIPTTSPTDPLAAFFSFHSSQRSPTGSNVSSVDDPTIDAALAAVESSADFSVVDDAMGEFQKASVEQTVEIPLFRHRQVDLRLTKVHNDRPNPNPSGLAWNAAEWFIGH